MMRVLICEDAPSLQALLSTTVTEQGHTVLAVTDNTFEGAQLAQRFRPDVVVLDLELETGLGRDTINDLDLPERKFPIVVLSAYAREVHTDLPGVAVVDKADVGAFRAVLVRLAKGEGVGETQERRHASPRVDIPPREGAYVDDPPPMFYAALEHAQADDVIVVVRPSDPARLGELAKSCRAVIRVQDFLLRQPSYLVALLFGGGEPAALAVAARVGTLGQKGDPQVSSALITADDHPADVFAKATKGEG